MKKTRNLQLFATFLLLVFFVSPSSTWALTTFGKTNPQNQNPQPSPTPVGKARECKLESECAGIQNTTCMADPRDGRTRCLCGDFSPPLNGACTNKFKALHAPCNEDSECVDGAHCVQRNNTSEKRCYCKEGYYEEKFLLCSGGSSVCTFHTTLLLITLSILKRSLC